MSSSDNKLALTTSWGDWMKTYTSEKRAPPQLAPGDRAQSCKPNPLDSNSFNPLLGRYRAAEREESMAAAEALARDAARASAQNRAATVSSKREFNIVSNKLASASTVTDPSAVPDGSATPLQSQSARPAARATSSALATTGVGSLHYRPYAAAGGPAARATALDQLSAARAGNANTHSPVGSDGRVTRAQVDANQFWAFFDKMPSRSQHSTASENSNVTTGSASVAYPATDAAAAHAGRDGREFDVISNRYWVDNDARVAREREAQCARAGEYYSRTYAVDIVAGRFVSPALEAQFQRERARA